jgi:predicted PurR-regulated permease PerM
MGKPQRISYLVMAALLVLVVWLHLGTLTLTVMFGYFALRLLSFGGRRWLAALIYVVAVAGIGVGLFFFSKAAFVALPDIAEKVIPAVANYAEQRGIELGFTDYASLRTTAVQNVRESFASVGHYAGAASFVLIQLVIGLVVALSMFLNTRRGKGIDPAEREGMYGAVAGELGRRARAFFASFALVIGAQITISLINTCLTTVFIVWNRFPYGWVIIVLTFLCGLLPIIGNLLSNTLIIGVSFTMSPRMALVALIFLVLIHKLEYFLNSKIIGDRIKNPMWLTLIALVLGERIMGIPGMILAPVVLHYVKMEASARKAMAGEALERAA